MAGRRFGVECDLCRDRLRKGEEVYLAMYTGDDPRKHVPDTFLLCAQCSHEHVKDYAFLSYLVFVGGVSK